MPCCYRCCGGLLNPGWATGEISCPADVPPGMGHLVFCSVVLEHRPSSWISAIQISSQCCLQPAVFNFGQPDRAAVRRHCVCTRSGGHPRDQAMLSARRPRFAAETGRHCLRSADFSCLVLAVFHGNLRMPPPLDFWQRSLFSQHRTDKCLVPSGMGGI